MALRPRQAPVTIAFVVSLFHPAPCPLPDADEIDAPASPRRPQGRVVRDNEIHPGIYLLVDLSFPGTDEPFFEEDGWYYLNGSRLVPGEHFNALLYLDVSPMMRSLGR